jgi:hypothetical protein
VCQAARPAHGAPSWLLQHFVSGRAGRLLQQEKSLFYHCCKMAEFWTAEPVIVKLLRSPRIDFQPGGSVRQPYVLYRSARLHRLAESTPRNRFRGSLNVYKYGLWTQKWPWKNTCGLGNQRPRRWPNAKFHNFYYTSSDFFSSGLTFGWNGPGFLAGPGNNAVNSRPFLEGVTRDCFCPSIAFCITQSE